ncbi:MAG: hypothetical protein LBJ48_03895, partial [Coriobacteriales bacterium]|nr:hypothetical protein [Coriobacteriales bacterium]
MPLIVKAEEMGYETHVFAWADDAVGADAAHRFYPLSVTEHAAILEVCLTIEPVAVCTIGSDLAQLTASYLCDHLGLPGNPLAVTQQATNKYQARLALRNAGIACPQFVRVERGETPDLSGFAFPLIVKPTDRSGSRAITKLATDLGLEAAIGSAQQSS